MKIEVSDSKSNSGNMNTGNKNFIEQNDVLGKILKSSLKNALNLEIIKNHYEYF